MPTEKSMFDPEGIDNNRIEKYKPKLEGVGGQQIVYSFPDYPNIVAKVEMATLFEQVAANTINTEDNVLFHKDKDGECNFTNGNY